MSRGQWDSLLAFDRARLNWHDALRGSIITAAIMVVPIWRGDLAAAIPLSIGAAFAAVAESGMPLGRRWRTMLWTTGWLMAAAAVGIVLSETPLLAVLVTAPVAFAAGAAGLLSPRAAVIGLLTLVIFAIYVGVPEGLDDAPTTAALIGLGGLIQTAVCVAVSLAQWGRREGSSMWSALRTAQDIEPIWPRLRRFTTSPGAFLSHATRLMIVMVIATAISESVAVPHQYWLPMSVAWMSKPDLNGTVARVIHRLVGTALGLIGIGAMVIVFRPQGAQFVSIAIIGAALAIAFIWVNYATAVAGVTIWVMALFAMVGDPVVETMGLRMGATVLAAGMVLFATWVGSRRWPALRHQI